VASLLFCASAATALGESFEPPTPEELLFRDFFRMPVGSRGLEPSSRLIDLDEKLIRIRGYMAHQELPTPGVFILSPLPVELGDADESLSDDLPPAVVFVHFDGPAHPYVAGLLQLTGTLHVGPHDEADGHVSQVRAHLDASQLAAAVAPLSPTTGAPQQAPGRSP
jgi:hypothetical protein